jgi:hypothetical protein
VGERARLSTRGFQLWGIVAVWCGAYSMGIWVVHVPTRRVEYRPSLLQPMIRHSTFSQESTSSFIYARMVEHQTKQCRRWHLNPILFDLMLRASKSPGDKGPHARIFQHGNGVSVAPLGTEIPAPKITTKICRSWSPRRKKMSVNVTMKMKRNAIATLKTTWSRRGPMIADALMWKNII